jgi:UDP-glucuronate 4-epimerase
MRVLVTGIAGFIGSHLAERLLARGDEIAGLDNFDLYYPRAVKERNLGSLRQHVEVVEGDVLDRDVLDRTLAAHRPDAIVHLAALAGVRPSLAAPARYQRVNVEGTAHVAEAALRHGVGKLLFASSSSVYGDNEHVPYRETDAVDRPASPYAASKRAAELLLRSLHRARGLACCSLRYFTVYGPRQRPEMAIHEFCRRLRAGQPVRLFGDGTTSRDYTFIDDIVDGTVAALDRAPAGATIYNLGGTRPIALCDLVARIGLALGVEPRIEPAPLQPGDVMHTFANVDAAARDLGYAPKVALDEGLARFVAWLDQQPT